jgi:hypothetical protein
MVAADFFADRACVDLVRNRYRLGGTGRGLAAVVAGPEVGPERAPRVPAPETVVVAAELGMVAGSETAIVLRSVSRPSALVL